MPAARLPRRHFATLAIAGALLASCDPPLAPQPEQFLPTSKIRVVATTTHLADLARLVGGDAVVVECLCAPKDPPAKTGEKPAPAKANALPEPWIADPFQLSFDAQRMFALRSATLAVFNGLGLEPWLNAELLAELKKTQVLTMTAGDQLKQEDILKGPDGAPDPCIWNSPRMLQPVVEGLRDTLCSLVDERARPVFERNAHRTIMMLQETDRWIAAKLKDPSVKRPSSLASHDTLAYFGRDYGIDFLTLRLATNKPAAMTKEQVLDWLLERGVNVYCYDLSLTLQEKVEIGEDYTLIHPRPYCSRWLQRPGALQSVGATQVNIGTCDGAIRSIAYALEGKRLGGDRRIGAPAPPAARKDAASAPRPPTQQ